MPPEPATRESGGGFFISRPERRAAVLFHIAGHIHGQSEVERAWRLHRWAVRSLMDEYAGEG